MVAQSGNGAELVYESGCSGAADTAAPEVLKNRRAAQVGGARLYCVMRAFSTVGGLLTG